jgi:anti-anti-sigma regulatory factor
MSLRAYRFSWDRLNMRQTTPSPTTLSRRKPVSRVSELARFASRVNRGMKVDVESDIVVITPSETLGTLRYQELHLEVGRINDLLRHGGFQNLLIDLSERRRVENVILMALVGFCRSIPGKAAFCGVSDDIRQSMETSKLLSLWPLYASRSEGLRAMSGATDSLPSECKQASDA